MKVSDLSGVKPPKILLYGDMGTWKTSLALTLGDRASVLDLDDGLMTGVRLEDKWSSARRSVDVKQFLEPEPNKRATVFQAAKQYIYSLADQVRAGKWPFDAFIVDSLSSYAESAVAQVMYNSGMVGQAPQLQHWGLAFSEIKNVIAVLRPLPIVVVLIAHEQVKTIGKGAQQEDKLEIALPGKNLASQIARYFDEVWYSRVRPLGANKFEQVLQTYTDGKIPCRSRACIPNYTNTECGMWELIKRCGYEPKAKAVVA